MQTVKVGIREFREKLASFLESKAPIAVTRHGETIGLYIPTLRKPKDVDLKALKTAAAQLAAMMQKIGVTEDDLVADFKKVRGSTRRG